MGKMWRPQRPAKAGSEGKAKWVAVTAVDGEVETSVLGVPVAAAAGGREKGPLQDGIAGARAPVTATNGKGKVLVQRNPVIPTVDKKINAKGVEGVQAIVGNGNGKDEKHDEERLRCSRPGMAKMWRPRQPKKVQPGVGGVKDDKGVAVIVIDGEVDASVIGVPVIATAGGRKKGQLEDGIAVCRMDALDGSPVIATGRKGKVSVQADPTVHTVDRKIDALVVERVQAITVKGKHKEEKHDEERLRCSRPGMAKMWRPRRPTTAQPGAGGVKDDKGLAVIVADEEVEASVIGVPVIATVGGRKKGQLEDGITVCRMDALDGSSVIATDGKGKVSVQADPMVPIVDRKIDALVVEGVQAITVKGNGKEEKHDEKRLRCSRGGMAKMWRPRRPTKAQPEAGGVKDDQGVVVIAVDREVEASVLGLPVIVTTEGGEKGQLEDGIAMCRMDALDGAPVIATGGKGEVSVQADPMVPIVGRKIDAPVVEGVQATAVKGNGKEEKDDAERSRQSRRGMGKLRRPRRPTKAQPEARGVKDDQGVVVIAVDGEVEASVLGLPVIATTEGGEKGQLEDGIAMCRMDALDGTPVIATGGKDEVSMQADLMVPVVGRKIDAPVVEGVQATAVKGNGKEEKDDAERSRHSRRGMGKLRRPRRPTKAQREARGVKDDQGVVVIAVDEEVKASVLGVPVIATTEGGEKGQLEDVIAIYRTDALDGAPVIATDGKDMVQVDPIVPAVDRKIDASVVEGVQAIAVKGNGKEKKDGEELSCRSRRGMGKLWRPQQPAKAPPEAGGVKDTEGVAVISVDGEVDVSVLENPVVGAAGGGEKGPLQDGNAVCRMDALDGAPVIATSREDEVSMQGDPVVPAVERKVDAAVAEGVQGNGKKKKGGERIKWLKHYSSAQSILIVGDGDFSFSLALATAFGSGENLVATSLDSYGALTSKYGKAESNVTELKRLGATVLHGVDAKTMKHHPHLEMRQFDRIVFNFPHAGFTGREVHLHVIMAHKQLVHGFFANARHLLRPYGETHLSHKTGFPYDAWDIAQLAYESSLIMVQKVDFSKKDYPGYNQKRGDGARCDQPFALGPCCTFMFCIGDVEKLKQAYGNWHGISHIFLQSTQFTCQ
ncbi:hypothetical protein ACQ4PT_003209 [Festuca glaucescens]